MSFHAYRAFFQKTGRMRFLSHHDLMRLFARALRRTGLPLRYSEGFTPRPILSFPLALAIGVESLDEIFEFELEAPFEPDELRRRLDEQMPGDGEIRFVRVEPVAKAGRTRVSAVEYRYELDPCPDDLEVRIRELLDRPSCPIERTLGPGETKTVDLRPYIGELRAEPGGLWARAIVTGQGAARPAEIPRLLGVESGAVRRILKTRTCFEKDASEIPDAR
jgi:radical SAM-linked protein